MQWNSTTIETELFLKSSLFWVLRSVGSLLRVVTDVSGQFIGPIFKSQPVQGRCRQHLVTPLCKEWSGRRLVLGELTIYVA